MESNKKLYLLDIARGFASISVIIWHWQHFSFNGTIANVDFDRQTLPNYSVLKLFYENGGTSIQFFFILSGFIFYYLYSNKIKEGKITAFNFSILRFSRLYPLHFVTLIIVLFQQIFLFHIQKDYFVYAFNDVYHFFLNIVFANYWGFQNGWSFNAPIWSISIEILLYILFYILSKIKLTNLESCFAVVFLSFVIRYYFYNVILTGLISFFMGGVIYNLLKFHYNLIFKYRKFVFALFKICWLIVVLQVYFNFLENCISQFGVMRNLLTNIFIGFILFPITIFYLVLFEFNMNQKSKLFSSLKYLAKLGDISYSTYLLHFPLQLCFGIIVAQGFLDKEFFLNSFYFYMFFMILIPISYLSFNYFEQPIKNRIRAKLILQIDT